MSLGYAPRALEIQSPATLTFDGEGGANATATLSGEPVAIVLQPVPVMIDFGFVPDGTTAVGCAIVTNPASTAVTIGKVASFDNEDGAFALATTDDATPPNPFNLPITLVGGARAKVCFQFTPPVDARQYSGQATLSMEDTGGSSLIVQLGGWGGGPQITCTPQSIDFGEVLSQHPSTVAVTCTNTGTAVPTTNLLIGAPTASPSIFAAQFDESFDGNHEPYPLDGLEPGQSTQIDVTYDPTATSNDVGTLLIESNGAQGKKVQIPLTGQGLSVPPCEFVVTPTSPPDFGNVVVGDTARLSFLLENVGGGIYVLWGLVIRDAATSPFQVLSTSIEPDPTNQWITIPASSASAISSLTVTLGFTPTTAGAFTGQLEFAISEGSGSEEQVALTGTGLSD